MKTKKLRIFLLTGILLFLSLSSIHAQVDTGGTKRANDHPKQVIGYINNFDAWKSTREGYPSPGALTHLNIDYSKYTMINYSYFGIAIDGSLHGSDFTNKELYKDGVVQQPADLLHTDIYSSWDLHILFGEIEAIHYISNDVVIRAQSQGFDVVANGTTWSNATWDIYNKPLPLPLQKEGGAKGLLELGKNNGVKILASIDGPSVQKHFTDIVSDPVKRANLINDCQQLINIGFDGININIEWYEALIAPSRYKLYEYTTILIEELRTALGQDNIITLSFPGIMENRLENFDWYRLTPVADYFNFKTYGNNGGWSNIAGHNAPLYDYPGQEKSGFSFNDTYFKLIRLGIPSNKINLGIAFDGFSIICESNGSLNSSTLKRTETVPFYGPIETCLDFDNFRAFEGKPYYETVRQITNFGTSGGWTKHWDDIAKVQYLTNGKYFLSYDDENSIGLKAQFIQDNGLAGVTISNVFGDLELNGVVTNYGTKLKRWSEVKSPLVNKVNEVFHHTTDIFAPTIKITSPTENTPVIIGSELTVTAEASDVNGFVTEVAFYIDGTLIGRDTTAPYTATFTPHSYSDKLSITAIATDNDNASSNDEIILRTMIVGGFPPHTNITSPVSGNSIKQGDTLVIEAEAEDLDGVIVSVEFFSGTTSLGVDTTAPYSISVDHLPEGTHTITTVATDNGGLTGISAGIEVNVSPICIHDPWVKGSIYTIGDIVTHNGSHWKCGWWTTTEPGTTGQWGAWSLYQCNTTAQ